MSTPMDPTRLAEIRARVEAASPGPWTEDVDPRLIRGPVPVDGITDVVATVTCCQGDQAFIAHARTDVPDLLAEVERLQRLLVADGHIPGVCERLIGKSDECFCIDVEE